MEYKIEPSPIRRNPFVNTQVPGYAEGEWTPTLGGTATYDEQSGFYEKIGPLVFVTCRLLVNTIGSGTTTVISGLPFPNALVNHPKYKLASFVVGRWFSTATAVVYLSGYTIGATSNIYLWSTTAAATGLVNTNPIFQNGTFIALSGSYFADR